MAEQIDDRDGGREGRAIFAGVLVLIGEELVVPAKVHQRGPLVGELELDPAHLAGILAAAVHEGFDDDLGERSGLIAAHLGNLAHCEIWTDVILHVGETDLGQFLENLTRTRDSAFGSSGLELVDPSGKVWILRKSRIAVLGAMASAIRVDRFVGTPADAFGIGNERPCHGLVLRVGQDLHAFIRILVALRHSYAAVAGVANRAGSMPSLPTPAS
jgi:hypothetical protein